MSKPLFSICIPTYNRSSILLDTLQKIVSCEAFDDEIEIIVSDNCSTDNTEVVCNELIKKHPQIRYFRNNKNINDRNFFLALERATGKYRKLQNDYMSITNYGLKKIKQIIKEYPDRLIFISGGYLYTKNIQNINLFDNAHGFISGVSTFTTYISFFGIWEDDIDKIKEPYRYSELMLNQVDWIYQYLKFRPKSVVFNEKNVYEMSSYIAFQKRGGYNWFDVHVKNYYDILSAHYDILSKNDIKRDKNYCLSHFKPELINTYIHKPLLWGFETKGTSKILFKYFYNIPKFYFYILSWPFVAMIFFTKHLIKAIICRRK